MRRTNVMRRCAVAAVCVALLTARARADDGETYQRAINSVVWVICYDKSWDMSFATGVVVDAANGYILTAYHVTGDDKLAVVVFPAKDKEGEIISTPNYYLENFKLVSALCVVVARDAQRDLALLKLKTPRTGLKAMPIAAASSRPGQELFTIGNAGTQGPLFRYASGSVRQVYADSFRFETGQEVNARIVSMTVPLNAGDSGGPLVNHQGELVGINSAVVAKDNQVQKGIDVAEIRAFLAKPLASQKTK